MYGKLDKQKNVCLYVSVGGRIAKERFQIYLKVSCVVFRRRVVSTLTWHHLPTLDPIVGEYPLPVAPNPTK